MAIYDRIAVDTDPEVKVMLLELCRHHERNMKQAAYTRLLSEFILTYTLLYHNDF